METVVHLSKLTNNDQQHQSRIQKIGLNTETLYKDYPYSYNITKMCLEICLRISYLRKNKNKFLKKIIRKKNRRKRSSILMKNRNKTKVSSSQKMLEFRCNDNKINRSMRVTNKKNQNRQSKKTMMALNKKQMKMKLKIMADRKCSNSKTTQEISFCNKSKSCKGLLFNRPSSSQILLRANQMTSLTRIKN